MDQAAAALDPAPLVTCDSRDQNQCQTRSQSPKGCVYCIVGRSEQRQRHQQRLSSLTHSHSALDAGLTGRSAESTTMQRSFIIVTWSSSADSSVLRTSACMGRTNTRATNLEKLWTARVLQQRPPPLSRTQWIATQNVGYGASGCYGHAAHSCSVVGITINLSGRGFRSLEHPIRHHCS